MKTPERINIKPGGKTAILQISRHWAVEVNEREVRALKAIFPSPTATPNEHAHNVGALIEINNAARHPYANEAVATAVVKIAALLLGRVCGSDDDVEFYGTEEALYQAALLYVSHEERVLAGLEE